MLLTGNNSTRVQTPSRKLSNFNLCRGNFLISIQKNNQYPNQSENEYNHKLNRSICVYKLRTDNKPKLLFQSENQNLNTIINGFLCAYRLQTNKPGLSLKTNLPCSMHLDSFCRGDSSLTHFFPPFQHLLSERLRLSDSTCWNLVAKTQRWVKMG